jgi:tetratricopeptide (TPR) repeat protein
MISRRASILAGMILTFATASVCHGRSLEVRIDSLTTLGMDTTRSFDDRVLSYKAAIKLGKSGVPMFRLASLYMQKGTRNDLSDSEYWYKGAIAHDRQNAVYRCAYAKLLWNLDDLAGANSQAKKALEINPDNLCGLYYAGKYATWGMDRNLTAVALASSKQVVVPFSLREFGEDRMSQAIHLLSRALEIDPDFGDARQTLGLVYYESEQYDEVIDLFAEGARRDLDDPNSFFFIGLALQAQKN